MRSLQGLELLVTVLLARNRQPPPTVAAGVPRAELAAELITLPSGLLAMVCEAIVKLKVRRGSCVCVRSCGCIGDGRGPTRSRRVHGAGHECWGPCSPRVGPTVCGVQEALRVVTFAAGFRCGPVSDVERLARLWRRSSAVDWRHLDCSAALGGVRDTAPEKPDPATAMQCVPLTA